MGRWGRASSDSELLTVGSLEEGHQHPTPELSHRNAPETFYNWITSSSSSHLVPNPVQWVVDLVAPFFLRVSEAVRISENTQFVVVLTAEAGWKLTKILLKPLIVKYFFLSFPFPLKGGKLSTWDEEERERFGKVKWNF